MFLEGKIPPIELAREWHVYLGPRKPMIDALKFLLASRGTERSRTSVS